MKTKLFGLLVGVMSLFIIMGTVSAAAVDEIQPAGATTFLESIRVGVAGQGGVTFFNGSVLNESGPMVIADDLRVDGKIWRTEEGGPDNLKIADTIMPDVTKTYDLGTSSNKWKNLYLSSTVYGGSAQIKNLKASGESRLQDEVFTYNLMPETAYSSTDFFPQGWIGYRESGQQWAGAYLNQVNTTTIYMYDPEYNGLTGSITNLGGSGSIAISGQGGDMELSASGNRVVIKSNSRLRLEPVAPIALTCNSSNEGEIIFNTFVKRFQGCNGTAWVWLD